MDAVLTRTVACRRYKNGVMRDFSDAVAAEITVRLRLDGVGERELFAAPIAPEELAVGHAALDLLPAGQVPVVRRAEGLFFELAAVPDTRRPADPSLPGPVPTARLLELVTRFIAAPGLWDGTGCFHRAALYDPAGGTFVARAEDIGRHNCLDRLAGCGLRQGLILPELLLFLSCRVTASMMAKALRAGLRLVVSRSAVTDAALDMAAAAGVTLVGFARDAEARFTVFTDSAGRVAA